MVNREKKAEPPMHAISFAVSHTRPIELKTLMKNCNVLNIKLTLITGF